jgi:hypothetical protein
MDSFLFVHCNPIRFIDPDGRQQTAAQLYGSSQTPPGGVDEKHPPQTNPVQNLSSPGSNAKTVCALALGTVASPFVYVAQFSWRTIVNLNNKLERAANDLHQADQLDKQLRTASDVDASEIRATANAYRMRAARDISAVTSVFVLGGGGFGSGRLCHSSSLGGVWKLPATQRGLVIENALGKNLPGNFPVIDRFVNGTATSIKSIDLSAKSYQSMTTLNRTVTGYIDKVAAFQGRQ